MAEPNIVTRRLASPGRHAGLGFIAGFLSTLIFHQGALAVLHLIGLTQRTPFVMGPVPPLGVPAVVSLAFWGGLWGIVFVYAVVRRRTVPYWLFAALFGAMVPTLVNWFISAPLHGRPLGGGWHGPDMLTAVLVNTAWGVGTALLLRWPFRQQPEG